MAEQGTVNVKDAEIDAGTSLLVVNVGSPFTYKVPSFPGLETELRQTTVQFESYVADAVAKVYVFNAFIRNDDVLNRVVSPFQLDITHCFYVQVDEFSKVVSVNDLQLLGEKVLILWEGEIVKDIEGSGSDSYSETASNSPDAASEEDFQETSQTVTFKCIGVLRDPEIQQRLKEIASRRDNGETILVRLQPEPSNPYDSRAIAFQAYLAQQWQRCGYVVKEITEHVHSAIKEKKIESVEFCWVRYKLWRNAPGYYAGINVTCRGSWHPNVSKFRSTFY